MSDLLSLGQKGENFAATFLENKGYKIRHRNWRSGKIEIDIIAETNEFVVFVEVKARSEDPLLAPQEAVTKNKQRSIIFAADTYIQRYDINKESRFDVISLIWNGKTFEADHIENAFYPTLR